MVIPEHLTALLIAVTGLVALFAVLQMLPKDRVEILLTRAGTGDAGRGAALDGLRAFLALGVVFSHAWSFHDYYYQNLPWVWPHNPWFFQSGSIAVPMFFMITGFLFWDKAIVAGGKIRAWSFYRNRARRILPLYYFLAGMVMVIAVVKAPAAVRATPAQFATELLRMVIPGWYPGGPLVGTERFYLMAQAWTLLYETIFYALFPLIALAAVSRANSARFCLALLLGLAIHRVLTHNYEFSLLSFWVGFATAEWRNRSPATMIGLRRWEVGAAIVLAAVVIPWTGGGRLGTLSFGCAAMTFVAVVAGNDIFGLLTLRGTRLLGAASYSVYLLHLVALNLTLAAVNRVWPIAAMANPVFGLLVAAAVFLIAAISVTTFNLIELPWLRGTRLPATPMPAGPFTSPAPDTSNP